MLSAAGWAGAGKDEQGGGSETTGTAGVAGGTGAAGAHWLPGQGLELQDALW